MGRVWCCLLVLWLSGCVATPEPGVFERVASAEIARRPSWYTNGSARAFLVSRDGQPRGLLWGTFHVGYGEDTMLPRPIRDRFDEAADLTVEFTMDRMTAPDRRAMMQAARGAMLEPDPAALAQLDAPTRAALDDADLPSGSAGRLSLMGLAYVVRARAMAEPSGSLPQNGFVDLNLMSFARNPEIPVYALEAPAVQTAILFANPNGAESATALRHALRLKQQGMLRSMFDWARKAYGLGRVAAALAVLDAWQADDGDRAMSERRRIPFLAKRNEAWIPVLDEILARPGSHFVAFGAAHLTGEDGVVALLRRQGWTVTPCAGDVCGAL